MGAGMISRLTIEISVEHKKIQIICVLFSSTALRAPPTSALRPTATHLRYSHPKIAVPAENRLPAPPPQGAGGADRGGHPDRVQAGGGGRRAEEGMGAKIISRLTADKRR